MALLIIEIIMDMQNQCNYSSTLGINLQAYAATRHANNMYSFSNQRYSLKDAFGVSRATKLQSFLHKIAKSKQSSNLAIGRPGIDLRCGARLLHGGIQRKRSVDLVTAKPACLLKKYSKKERQAKSTAVSAKKPISSKAKVTPVGNIFLRRQSSRYILKSASNKNQLNRQSSFMVQKFCRDVSLERSMSDLMAPKSTTNTPDDLLLDYLRKVLSKQITSSVYLKDYLKLFSMYRGRFNRAYRYRSKSEGEPCNAMSQRKAQFSRYCLFTDYIHNLYTHHELLRDRYGSVPLLYTKSTNIKKQKPLLAASRSRANRSLKCAKTLEFSFLTANENLKSFSLAVKHFNSKGNFGFLYNKGSRKPKHKRAIKMGRASPQVRLDNSQPNGLHIKKPVGNIKNAVLFQKLVKSSVKADETQSKKLFIKQTLDNCLKKSFFHVKRDISQKRVQMVQEKPKPTRKAPPKPVYIDVDKVYRIPKTFGIRHQEIRCRDVHGTSLKAFRLKSLNIGKSSTLDQNMSCGKLN